MICKKLVFIISLKRQSVEIDKLKNELNQKIETIKMKDHHLAKKQVAIENINKVLEKQTEKNDLCRVMSEWKLKRVENEKQAS